MTTTRSPHRRCEGIRRSIPPFCLRPLRFFFVFFFVTKKKTKKWGMKNEKIHNSSFSIHSFYFFCSSLRVMVGWSHTSVGPKYWIGPG